MKLVVMHAPPGFAAKLAPLPEGVKVLANGRMADQLHWFVKDQQQLHAELDKVSALLQPGQICWIYYPKGSSGIQTDLTRDKGWDALSKLNYQWLSLISFDETWSAFAVRNEPAKVPARKQLERPVMNYVDVTTRTVRVPEDLQQAFKKNRREKELFDSLAYSHKKEYVEWIVSAKKPETREKRVMGTIEKLQQGLKNPSAK